MFVNDILLVDIFLFTRIPQQVDKKIQAQPEARPRGYKLSTLAASGLFTALVLASIVLLGIKVRHIRLVYLIVTSYFEYSTFNTTKQPVRRQFR